MGVILKDKYGNTSDYAGVNQIEVPCEGYSQDTLKYTRLGVLKAYEVESAGSINGVSAYKILSRFQYLPSDDYFLFTVQASENITTCFITPKSLTVGQTYVATDMY